MYTLIRPLLFALSPELAHEVALKALCYFPKSYFPVLKTDEVEAMGIQFPHAVGLAAGLDKNAAYLDALAKLGFASIEVGTVTLRPQLGNPKPRLFRLPKAHAIINRMGFNNLGVDAVIANIQKAHFNGILGINIGKNKDTPLEQAANDYVACLQKVYPFATYVTVNISSPNTPQLRELQQESYFKDLLSTLREEQLYLTDTHQRYVPLVIKLSPDETDEALKRMADVILSLGIDGIIATNTTCDREMVQDLPHGQEAGGLSGRPLADRSTDVLRVLKHAVGDEVTLIAAGGIDSAAVAEEKIQAGASLLQIYTGLIYQGPGLIREIVHQMAG